MTEQCNDMAGQIEDLKQSNAELLAALEKLLGLFNDIKSEGHMRFADPSPEFFGADEEAAAAIAKAKGETK